MFKPKENLHQLRIEELFKYFESLFDNLSRTHGHFTVYESFLDCCLNGFCVNCDNEIMEHIRKKYTQDERYTFGEMLRVWILIMNKQVTDDQSVYDFFGTFYENQAMNKMKNFSQFFTPIEVAKLMALITINENKDSLMEPTCGSGRMNLAAHAINHRLIHVATDIDFTCAKMCALNFLIHGIRGIVIADDSLMPKTKFKGAFLVNYKQAPFMEFIDNVDVAYHIASSIVPSSKQPDATPKDVQQQPVQTQPKTTKSDPDLGTQLTLF